MKAKLNLAYYATLQEIRNYRFFYILVISILLTLCFVPPEDAAFSTISFADWQPMFNSEWIGTTTAIMSTVVLAMLGFYLIIDNLSKEKQYRMQEVLLTSPVSNFRFLFYRTLSGALLLLSILIFSMVVSILLSMYYNGLTGTAFLDIIVPYLLIAFPSAIVVATFSTILEVLFPGKRMIRYVLFLVFFTACIGDAMFFTKGYSGFFDPFGMQYSVNEMMDNVKYITQDELHGFSIGFSKNNPTAVKEIFEYNGTDFSNHFIWTRLFIVGLCFFLIALISPFFNRLKFFQDKVGTDKGKEQTAVKNKQARFNLKPLTMSLQPAGVTWRDYILAEIYLFQKWTSPIIAMLTIGLLLASFFMPLELAHRYLLPALILLQVPVMSDMLTREKRLRTEIFFKTAAVSDTQRMFHKAMSVLIILGILSTPIIIRYLITASVISIICILLGLVLITAISFLLGMVFRSKKPFELLMVLITYACVNKLEVVDYLGIYNPSVQYMGSLSTVCAAVVLIGLFLHYKFLRND